MMTVYPGVTAVISNKKKIMESSNWFLPRLMNKISHCRLEETPFPTSRCYNILLSVWKEGRGLPPPTLAPGHYTI